MKNREKVERVYSEIHAPEALVWKVMDMSKEMQTKKFKVRNVIKYAVCTLAIIMVTFIASNGICYAATGESLVKKIRVTIDGKTTEQDMNWKKDGDSYTGSVTIPGKDGSVNTFEFNTDSMEQFDTDIFIETDQIENEDDSVEEGSVTIEIRDNENVNSVGIENEEKIEE